MEKSKSILTALLFSSFIYFEELGWHSPILETIFGIGAIYFVLTLSRLELALSGFLVGLLWFFWIGFSMQYYGFPYLIPVVILFFGIVYGIHFYILGYWENIWIRAVLLILVNLFEPFGFNWFKPQIIFINSYFGTSLLDFGLIVAGVAFVVFVKSEKRWLMPIALLFFYPAIAQPVDEVESPNIKIKVVETHIQQGEKWKLENQSDIVQMNFREIEKAINEGYDMVVLPESTFPLFLNERIDILSKLLELSSEITIWTGGLLKEGDRYYNSTYLFHNGKFQIAKKVILVPFGEYIPLPDFLAKWINRIFFKGVQDFTPATKPTDFQIGSEKFRSAICYEATSETMYIDSPKFMVAISNNGWFLPSIEPSLQRLLIQHYANIYQVSVFHSANMRGSGVVYPTKIGNSLI